LATISSICRPYIKLFALLQIFQAIC